MFLLVILLALSASFSHELRLDIQPLLSVRERGDFETRGRFTNDIERARADFRMRKDIDEHSFRARLMVDFSESEASDLLKVAFVEGRFSPHLQVRIGRFKSPFGYESQLSNRDVMFIDRGELSSYIRKSVGAGGFLNGAQISGSIGDFEYSASIFDNGGFISDGGDLSAYMNRLISLPILTLSYEPNKNLLLYSSFAFPYFGHRSYLDDSRYTSMRPFVSSYAASLEMEKNMVTVELFKGVDSVKTRDYLFYRPVDQYGVSQGVSLSHSYRFDIADSMWLRLNNRFEYLRGWAYTGIGYDWSPVTYTITSGVSFYYTEDLYLHLNYSDDFSSSFKSQKNKEIALMFSAHFRTRLR